VVGCWLMLLQPALAWNFFGHMTVVWICYQRLKPEVRKRANDLLKLNPMYTIWLTQVNPAYDGEEQIFMLAATWPDHIKHAEGYVNDRVGGPASRQNIGYSDKNMHKYWHYVDIPYTQDHTPLPPLPVPNAKDMIPDLVAVLASDKSDELKSYDLCWLLHIVADIHQPLHTINRACKDSPHGDNGGNDIKITEKMAEPLLHKFVDESLGPDGPPDTAIAFAATLGQPDQKLAAERDLTKWIEESHELAIKKIYRKPIGPEDGPYTLTDKYKQMIRTLSRQRVELAGARLANLLNDSLK
jgi:hypothetical protein